MTQYGNQYPTMAEAKVRADALMAERPDFDWQWIDNDEDELHVFGISVPVNDGMDAFYPALVVAYEGE